MPIGNGGQFAGATGIVAGGTPGSQGPAGPTGPTGPSGPWGQASTAKFSGSGSPVGVVTPSGEGDLYVDDTTPGLWQASGATSADWAQVGTSAGTSIVRAFPFAFNSPGILTGHTVYTPTVGDILLDAWIEIDTAWNGTTPKGDFGDFPAVKYGWFSGFSYDGNPIDMTKVDTLNSDSTILAQNTNAGDGIPVTLSAMNVTYAASVTTVGTRLVPGKFTTADPIKVCVSQDGTNTGANPGSTQGAAVLYLVTATPKT